MAVERGAHVIRTHDVAETRDAALVGAEFARDRVRSDDGPSDIAVEELDVTTVREAERHLDRLDADQSVAGDAAVRTYELRGLTDEAVGALRAATAEPGVGAAFALAGSDAAETAVPPRPPTAGPHKWRIRTARRNSSRAVCGSIGRFGRFRRARRRAGIDRRRLQVRESLCRRADNPFTGRRRGTRVGVLCATPAHTIYDPASGGAVRRCDRAVAIAARSPHRQRGLTNEFPDL